jgi:hypothetical protein
MLAQTGAAVKVSWTRSGTASRSRIRRDVSTHIECVAGVSTEMILTRVVWRSGVPVGQVDGRPRGCAGTVTWWQGGGGVPAVAARPSVHTQIRRWPTRRAPLLVGQAEHEPRHPPVGIRLLGWVGQQHLQPASPSLAAAARRPVPLQPLAGRAASQPSTPGNRSAISLMVCMVTRRRTATYGCSGRSTTDGSVGMRSRYPHPAGLVGPGASAASGHRPGHR